jgi:hypothetical protein
VATSELGHRRTAGVDPKGDVRLRVKARGRAFHALGAVTTLCYSLPPAAEAWARPGKSRRSLPPMSSASAAWRDEDRTLARLRTLRTDLIDPTVAGQNGRAFKRTGDGALIEFRSVVEAVRCAIAIQNAMIERNLGMPIDQRIEFRVSIHLDDAIEESDGDLMGDGVHIAARLEGIAESGAICLSEQTYWR